MQQTSDRRIQVDERFVGDRVWLRLLTLGDCTQRYVSWLEDPEVHRYLETRWTPQTIESVRSFVGAMLTSADSYLFGIHEQSSGRHVGNIKLGPIHPRHSYADVSYFIGERDAWGRGYASDAIRVVTAVAFDRLGVHRVQAGLYSGNVGSARALEKAGFTLEARFAAQLRGPDGWEDHLWYARLRDDSVRVREEDGMGSRTEPGRAGGARGGERGSPGAPRIEESNRLWARATGLIPAGTQTLSKGPSQYALGFGPKYLARARGSHVWDVDGNEYVDYPMGLGPVTLGHAHPEVVAAVVEQLARGTCFSLMHPLEVELAERVRDIVPCAEMVRFGKNGSDATAACIRASRAKTGRKHVARCGYHGWQDWSIDRSYGIRARGVPDEVLDLTIPFPYNDLAALDAILTRTPCAAVILEPISVTPPETGYLEGVRALATRHGAVLVFDEVITGFRYARGGAQEYFGVTPDLASMGKGVANGMPLSLVVGRREFMQPFEEIFFSFTFGGEAASLAAAIATLNVMEREDYWAHCWRQGRALQDGYRSLAAKHGLSGLTDCAGLPPWTVVTFADHGGQPALKLKTLFQQEMLRRGILFSGSQFISLSHSDEDIQRTIEAYDESMGVLRSAIDQDAVDRVLVATPNELIFRRA